MAVRSWQVRPDVQVPTQEYGLVPAVSRGLIDQAFLDGAAMVANAGGVFTVVSGRHPTDLPHEMLTTWLVCEWKDRTDAKPSPEPTSEVLPTMEPEPEYEAEAHEELAPERAEATLTNVSPDGLDESMLEDEDMAEIPESVR